MAGVISLSSQAITGSDVEGLECVSVIGSKLWVAEKSLRAETKRILEVGFVVMYRPLMNGDSHLRRSHGSQHCSFSLRM